MVPFSTYFFFSCAFFILSRNLSTAFISFTIFFLSYMGDTLRLLDVSGLKVNSFERDLTISSFFFLLRFCLPCCHFMLRSKNLSEEFFDIFWCSGVWANILEVMEISGEKVHCYFISSNFSLYFCYIMVSFAFFFSWLIEWSISHLLRDGVLFNSAWGFMYFFKIERLDFDFIISTFFYEVFSLGLGEILLDKIYWETLMLIYSGSSWSGSSILFASRGSMMSNSWKDWIELSPSLSSK